MYPGPCHCRYVCVCVCVCVPRYETRECALTVPHKRCTYETRERPQTFPPPQKRFNHVCAVYIHGRGLAYHTTHSHTHT
jgi:hypothetical protein